MGFQEVFLSLEELFPLVDPRALRAVAIEHSNDVDSAVMAVLDEIVPYFTEIFTASTPLTQIISAGGSSDFSGALVGATIEKQPSSSDNENEPFYDAYDGHHAEDKISELTSPEKSHGSVVQMCANVYSPGEPVVLIDENRIDPPQIEMSRDPQTQESISGDKCPESGIQILSDSITQHRVETSQGVGMGISEETNLLQESEDITRHVKTDFGTACNEEIHQEKSSADGNNPFDETSLLSVDNNIAPGLKTMTNIINTEEESTLNVTMSQSSMDVIEEAIADARNNKKTLFSEMESIISLMRQVELKEQSAEQAKVEAAKGGMDIQNKVDELKRMLQYAKEANDMHAGEVYGEKAILATELKELQSRVCSLSNERDVSLAILDEMRQSLEVRLAAAENEIKSAEQETLVKEKTARKSLDDQELIMEKVVQESKILKRQAEENSKLQEFLVDRGRVVDALQGEIAVICQDVRVLKEKFDQRLPFSKSLYSSHTSFILASSNSSLKSLVPDQVRDTPVGEFNSFEIQRSYDHELVTEEEAARDVQKALQDEGWELLVDAEIAD